MHCELSWTSHACSNTWLSRISRLCSFNLLPWTEWNPCGVALWIWRTSPMSPSVGCSTASHPSFWMARCLFFSSFPLVWHWLHGHLKGSQTTLRVPLNFHSNYAYYSKSFFSPVILIGLLSDVDIFWTSWRWAYWWALGNQTSFLLKMLNIWVQSFISALTLSLPWSKVDFSSLIWDTMPF